MLLVKHIDKYIYRVNPQKQDQKGYAYYYYDIQGWRQHVRPNLYKANMFGFFIMKILISKSELENAYLKEESSFKLNIALFLL